MNTNFAETFEYFIKERVNTLLKNQEIPNLTSDIIATDNLAEVIEKLIILHIRTWFLEDMAGIAKSDSELADIKRKIDICFKQKRPMYLQAINKLIDTAITTNKSLKEDSVKIYKNF